MGAVKYFSSESERIVHIQTAKDQKKQRLIAIVGVVVAILGILVAAYYSDKYVKTVRSNSEIVEAMERKLTYAVTTNESKNKKLIELSDERRAELLNINAEQNEYIKKLETTNEDKTILIDSLKNKIHHEELKNIKLSNSIKDESIDNNLLVNYQSNGGVNYYPPYFDAKYFEIVSLEIKENVSVNYFCISLNQNISDFRRMNELRFNTTLHKGQFVRVIKIKNFH